jgi:MFS family permease
VAAGTLPGFLAAGAAPRIRGDFAFSDAALGVAAATFYIVSTILTAVLGRVVDRLGARRGMLIGAAGTIAACIGIAALAQSAVSLTAMLVVAAIGNSLASPSVSKMLQAVVPEERHGIAFGAQQAGAPIGALIAGLALPLVAIPFGWRWAFVGAAGLMLAAAVAAPARDHVAARPKSKARQGLGVVHALGLASFFASTAGMGFVSFLVVYAVENGVAESPAGLLLAAVSLCAAVGRMALGVHADRSGQDALRPVVPMFVASVAGYALLIPGEPVLIVLAALVVGSFGWAWPGAINLAVIQHAPDAPAWAVGVMLSGLFAGAIAGPLTIGFLAEHDMWTAAWLVCAVFTLLSAATVAAVRRHDAQTAD